MGPTARLAQFVHETTLEHIPSTVTDKAKTLILNVLGSTIAGSTEETGRIGIDLVRQAGGVAQSTVVGGGFKTSPMMAALANGISAHATDQDDTDWATLAHPTVAILPAMFALGEATGASGSRILEAYILGVEAEGRVGLAVGPLHQLKLGFHPTGTMGHIGATVACCKVLDLNAKQVETALGIVGSLASAMRHNTGSMTKPLHAGNAARNGVMSAQLAQKGFTSIEGVLETAFGFTHVFGGSGGNPELATKNLGSPYIIEVPGITMKADACGTYGSVLKEGLQAMIRDYRITPDEVASVDLTFNPELQKIMRFVNPANALEASYSITFVVAVTLLEGDLKFRHFTDEKAQDPRVRDMISKIRFHAASTSASSSSHSGGQLSATLISVKLKDGTECSHMADSAKGYVNQPFSEDELHARYREFAGMHLVDRHIDRTADMVKSLEKLPDISELMELLG